MGQILVRPNFKRQDNQLQFPSKSLNFFAREEVLSDFDFWQRRFGCFGWMQLTKLQKYILHTLSGSPFLWQPHRNCAWDPTGSLRVRKQELTPVNAKINEELCYDDFFNSCFEQFLNWRGTDAVRLDANGERVLNEVTRMLVEQAAEGARITMTVGGLYDPSSIVFADGVTEEAKALFKKTIDTANGYLLLLKSMGADAATRHLDLPGAFSTSDFDTSGERYTGDVIALFDKLKSAAKPSFRRLINKGSMVRNQTVYQPLFKVSDSIYSAIVDTYNEQCISNVCINPRLTAENIVGGSGNGDARRNTTSHKVYYIDGIPVVPLSDVNCYDEYLTGTTHFAALAASGVICMGGSFGNIPSADQGVGLIIQRETSLKELGKIYWAAHSLMSTQIADTDYIVATQQYVVPA